MAPVRNTIGMALALFGWGCVLCHCSAPPPKLPPTYCVTEKAFTEALLACVDAAPTRLESRACRKRVHEACGVVETVSEVPR